MFVSHVKEPSPLLDIGDSLQNLNENSRHLGNLLGLQDNCQLGSLMENPLEAVDGSLRWSQELFYLFDLMSGMEWATSDGYHV
jgi:hypothetical protein